MDHSKKLIKSTLINGLWKQNPGFIQLLGMCPLLAMSNSIVNATSLGLATIFVMIVSSGLISLLKGLIPYEIRIPIFILIIASVVTAIDAMMNAWLHSLYTILGIFIPLIVTNCIILARIEAFAIKNSLPISLLDALVMGAGLTIPLIALGAIREVIGQGTLLSGIDTIFPSLKPIVIMPIDYPGFLITLLPPGAFFILGMMIAVYNWINSYFEKKSEESQSSGISISQKV